MSPQVRLVTYPDGDGAFSAHTLQLTVELPAAYSPDDVVQEIERRLRETYPLAPAPATAARSPGTSTATGP
jgi:hypothetical protein